jgi:hypothetical protein
MMVTISTVLLGLAFIFFGYRAVGPRKGPVIIVLIGAVLVSVAKPDWAKAVNDGVISVGNSISRIGQ